MPAPPPPPSRCFYQRHRRQGGHTATSWGCGTSPRTTRRGSPSTTSPTWTRWRTPPASRSAWRRSGRPSCTGSASLTRRARASTWREGRYRVARRSCALRAGRGEGTARCPSSTGRRQLRRGGCKVSAASAQGPPVACAHHAHTMRIACMSCTPH